MDKQQQQHMAFTLIKNGQSLATVEQLEVTGAITEYTAELFYFVWRNSTHRFGHTYKCYESPSNHLAVQTWLQDKTESGFSAVIEQFDCTKAC